MASSIYHKIYVALGGKKGSFLQRHWEKLRIMHANKEKSRLLPVYGIEMLKLFKKTCDTYKLKGWLEYGTLLGAYREHSFIPHDYDLDVGMYADDYSPSFEQALMNCGFIKIHEYYLVNGETAEKRLSEVGFVYNGFSIDIFLTKDEGENRKSYIFLFDSFINSSKMKVKYFTLKGVEPLQTLTIDGESFNVPSHPEDMLFRVYGEDFMIPQRGWRPRNNNPYVKFVDLDKEFGEHIRF